MPIATVAALLLAFTFAAQSSAPAPDLRNLHWVRATIAAVSPDSLTLRLRDRELVVQRDPTTQILSVGPSTPLAVGAIVEAHYAERKGVRRAIVVIADAGPGAISKRPGSSLRGTVLRLRRSTLTMASGGRTRALSLERSSRLLDHNGHVLATGKDAIAPILAADMDLLVKYTSDDFVLDGLDLSGNDNVVELRQLR